MGALVRAHDWSATPLGPVEDWPPELKAMTGLLLGQSFPMILLWGPDLLQIYNDGYRDLMGSKHPAGLGAPTRETWAEVWAFNEPIYQRVRAGETLTLTDQLFPIKRAGAVEDAWFSLCYSPARTADGAIAGVFITVSESTARLRQDAQREQRFRTLFEAIDQGFYYARAIFDDEGRCVDIHYHDENSAAIRLTGRPAKGRLLSELGSYEDHWRDIFGRVARTGQAQRLEQFARADGLWYDFYVFRPAEAGPDEFAVVFRDITERRRAEEAIRASEERLRRIVENARDYAILTIDPDGIVEQWHQGAEAVFGWSAEEMIGRCADETFVPEDRDAGVPQQERDLARRNGSAPNIRWHARKDGSRVFIDGIVTALHGPGGEVSGFLKIGQDTTARRQAEEHQRFLLAELQHRVRNTLGVIRSIARRTAASSGSVEEMWAHLQGRIDAFSRVQAVVTRDPDAGVDLAALIEDELLAHAAREGKKLRIAGPAVTLKPQPAESLSLAIHELATNAVKYGALSSDRGRLAVRWSREGDDGDEQLVLTWQESGVDHVEPEPARHGFGLELLQRTLPYELDARTEVEFSAQGMRFSLRMPLSRHMLARAT